MLKKFFQQLNNAVLGGLSVFIFFVLGFLWWIFDADTLVPMWLLSALIIGCYLICIIVYGLCSIKEVSYVYRLPAIRSIKKINDKYIFIVEKNDLFNQGSLATICYQEDDDDLEVVLGLGYVQTINSAGYMQIVVENLSELYAKIEDTAFYRKSIRIKPSVDKKLLEEVIVNG